MRTPLLAASLVALTLAGCGDSSNDDDTGAPDCSDVWVAGETLPADYEGCKEGGDAGFAVLLSYGDCEITTYDDRYYAVLGEEIAEADGDVAEDEGYAALIDECNGVDPEDDEETDSPEEESPSAPSRPDGAVGDPLDVGTWTVKVTDIQRQADQTLAHRDLYNDPARDGYLLVTFEARYGGTERTADAEWDLTWTFTTADKQVHDSASLTTPADNEEWPTEARSGGTVRGQVVFDIDDALFHGGVLTVEAETEDNETEYAEMWL